MKPSDLFLQTVRSMPDSEAHMQWQDRLHGYVREKGKIKTNRKGEPHIELYTEVLEHPTWCAICTTPLSAGLTAFLRNRIVPNTFTDLGIFRLQQSAHVCESCACMIATGRQGAPFAWGYLAWIDGDQVVSHFPWKSSELAWFDIPNKRPLVAVYPGKKYGKKHTIIHGSAVHDASVFGFWNGDVGSMCYLPITAQDEIKHYVETLRHMDPETVKVTAVMRSIKAEILNKYRTEAGPHYETLLNLTESALKHEFIFSRKQKREQTETSSEDGQTLTA